MRNAKWYKSSINSWYWWFNHGTYFNGQFAFVFAISLIVFGIATIIKTFILYTNFAQVIESNIFDLMWDTCASP